MEDLKINVESIYYALTFINASKERLTELSTALDNIDISGVQLRTAGLLSSARTTVKKILNDTLSDINKRLDDTKNVIIENDVEALLLFAYLDGEFNDEFGNFSEEKVNEYIEKKNQELYEEAVKKAEEEHNNKFNNDPSYRYDVILANLLSQNGYESLQQIDDKKEEFMTKIKDLQKRKNEILYSDAQMTLKFLDIIDGTNNYTVTNFNSLSKREILAYRYIDENGLEIYCDSQLAIPNQYIGKVEALTYSDMCGETEFYNKVKSGFEDNLFYAGSLPSYLTGNSYIMNGVGTTGSYSKTKDYEDFYNEVTNITINEQSKLEEINTMLSSAEGELSNLVSLKQGILDYAHYYTYDEFGYILRDDFDENCKNISEDEIDVAINNIKNKAKFSSTNNDNIPGALSFAYTSTSITLDTREEQMQVIYSLISGNDKFSFGKGSVSYVDENGKQIYLESKDDLFSNYSMWASEMTKEQKQIFYYNWNTGGYEAAYEYLDSISDVLDSTYIVNQTKRDQEFASAHPGTASALSVLMGPIKGLDAIRYSIQQKFNNDKMYRSQLYAAGDTMRNQVSEDIGKSGKFGAKANAFMYNVSMSVADNLFSMVLTGGNPVASGIILGAGGYDNSINDALSRGLTDDQARLYATSMAVVEAATESWSLDKLVNIKWLKNLDGKKTLTQILGKTFDQAKSEGLEELTSSIVGEWVDQLIAGENSAFNLSVQDYIAHEYTEEQALVMAQQDQLKEFGTSFLSGFASGGMTGGGKITGSYISYVHQNHKNKNMFIDSLGSVVSENIRSNNFDVAIDAIMNQEGKTNAEKVLYANTVIAALESFQVIDGDMKQKLNDAVKSFVESRPDVKVNSLGEMELFRTPGRLNTEVSETNIDNVTLGVPTIEESSYHNSKDVVKNLSDRLNQNISSFPFNLSVDASGYRGTCVVNNENFYVFNAKKDYNEYNGKISGYDFFNWLVDSEGRYVGYVTAAGHSEEMLKETEITYEISEKYQGKGFATELLKFMVNDIFENGFVNGIEYSNFKGTVTGISDVKKINLAIADWNIASQRVAEKNGFIADGYGGYVLDINSYHNKQNIINFIEKYSNIGANIDIKTLQQDIIQSGVSLEDAFSIESINSRFQGENFTEIFSGMSVEDVSKLIFDERNYDFVKNNVPFTSFYVNLVNGSQSLEQVISILEKFDTKLLGGIINDLGFNYSLNDIVANTDNKKFLRNIIKNVTRSEALSLFKDMSYENIRHIIISFSMFNTNYRFYSRICNELGFVGNKDSLLAFIYDNANSSVFNYNNNELTRLLNLKYSNIDLYKTENIEILKKDILDSGLPLTYFMKLDSISKVGLDSEIFSNLFESMTQDELLSFLNNYYNIGYCDFVVRHQNMDNLVYILNQCCNNYFHSDYNQEIFDQILSLLSSEQITLLFSNSQFKLLDSDYRSEIIKSLVDESGIDVLLSAIESDVVDFSSLTSSDLSLNSNNLISMQYFLDILFDENKMESVLDSIKSGYNYDANYTNKEILFGIVKLFEECRTRNYNLKFSNEIVSDFYRLYKSLYSSNTREDIVRFIDTYTLDKSKLAITSNSKIYGRSDGKVGVDQHSIVNASQYSILDLFNPSRLATVEGLKLKNLLVDQMKQFFPGISRKFAVDFLKKTDIGTDLGGTGGICNYADVCNAIFEYFDKKGYDEFERTFGFPMYLDGHLNDAQLLLDMFINIAGKEIIGKSGKIVGDRYNITGKMSDYANLTDTFGTSYVYRGDYIGDYLKSKGIIGENDLFIQKSLFISRRSDFYGDNYINSNTLRESNDFVANDILIKIHNALKNGEHLSISSEIGLKMETLSGKVYDLEGGHIMSIYGIDNNGNLLVDSWGGTYKINLKKSLDDGIRFDIGSIDLNAIGKVNTQNYSSMIRNDKVQDKTNGNNSRFNSVDNNKINGVSLLDNSVGASNDSKAYSDIILNEELVVNEFRKAFESLMSSTDKEIQKLLTTGFSLDYILNNGLIHNDVPNIEIYKKYFEDISDKKLMEIILDEKNSSIVEYLLTLRYDVNFYIDLLRSAKTPEYANFILSKINSNYYSTVIEKLQLYDDHFVQSIKHALEEKVSNESILMDLINKLNSYFPNGKINTYSVYIGDITDYVNIDCSELLSIVADDNRYVEFLGTKLNFNEKNYYQYLNAFCTLKDAIFNLKLDSNLSSVIIGRLNRLESEYKDDISRMEIEVENLKKFNSNRKYFSYVVGGIKYNIPSNIDKSKQNLTVFDINKIISTMPKKLRSVVKEVNIYDTKNPLDPFWTIAYNKANFVSAATGGSSRINIYSPSSLGNRSSSFFNRFLGKDISDTIFKTIYHESGHCFDDSLNKISNSIEWEQAISEDISAPSSYCKASKSEDFAESIAFYILNREEFSKNFPNRAKILDRILN